MGLLITPSFATGSPSSSGSGYAHRRPASRLCPGFASGGPGTRAKPGRPGLLSIPLGWGFACRRHMSSEDILESALVPEEGSGRRRWGEAISKWGPYVQAEKGPSLEGCDAKQHRVLRGPAASPGSGRFLFRKFRVQKGPELVSRLRGSGLSAVASDETSHPCVLGTNLWTSRRGGHLLSAPRPRRAPRAEHRTRGSRGTGSSAQHESKGRDREPRFADQGTEAPTAEVAYGQRGTRILSSTVATWTRWFAG